MSPLVQLIIGNKGRGKTRYLLEKVNSEVKDTLGNICYLDKSSKHMFELNNRVRLINVSDFAIENTDEFIGFICGIISQDHDLEQMYFDSFLKIAHLEGQARFDQYDYGGPWESSISKARFILQCDCGNNLHYLSQIRR